MPFDNVNLWSMLVTICALALFIEAVFMARTLILTRRALYWYLLLLVPLAVSAWSIIVATGAITQAGQISLLAHLHLTPVLYQKIQGMLGQLILVCQVQAAITVAVFALCAFIERKALPRFDRPPLWTLAREHRMLR